MHAIWRDKGMFNITEQRFMEQQSQSINQSKAGLYKTLKIIYKHSKL